MAEKQRADRSNHPKRIPPLKGYGEHCTGPKLPGVSCGCGDCMNRKPGGENGSGGLEPACQSGFRAIPDASKMFAESSLFY